MPALGLHLFQAFRAVESPAACQLEVVVIFRRDAIPENLPGIIAVEGFDFTLQVFFFNLFPPLGRDVLPAILFAYLVQRYRDDAEKKPESHGQLNGAVETVMPLWS